jgi:integrase
MGRHKQGYSGPQGLVKQKGSPNWYIKWRHLYKSTGTPDLEKARLIFIEVQRLLFNEELRTKEILGKSISFSKLIERYLKEVSPLKLSPKSDETNSIYPLKFFSEKKIDTFRAQDAYKYQDWRKTIISERKKRPVSGATINREISLIRHALKQAVKWGMIETSPFREIEGLKEMGRERYLTDQEFDTIKKIALLSNRSAHLADFMDALYHSAQRWGRIRSLKWSQINFQNRTISFEERSKTKQAPFVLWINDRLLELISRIKAERGLKKIISPYVFQKCNGRPYGSIKTVWTSCREKAGVQNARIHDIRHKAVTDMARAGVPVQKIKQAVGHRQIATTEGYTHLTVEFTREALDSLVRR